MAAVAALVASLLFVFRHEALTRWTSWLFGPLDRDPPEACTAVGEPVYNTTQLKVVLPSTGQTGTTSVLQAIRQLGYRSYHDEETRAFAPTALVGVLESEHLFVEPISRCRVEALSLEPYLDLLPYAVQTSRDARFILTWRNYSSWSISTVRGGVKDSRFAVILDVLIHKAFRFIPLRWWYDAATEHFSDTFAQGNPFIGDGEATILSVILSMSMGRGPRDFWFDTFSRGSYKVLGQEEAYLAHIDEIRRLVPPERLLEFDVERHGWNELVAFLGQPAPPAGTPFPRVRAKDSRTNFMMLYRNYAVAAAAFGIFLLVSSLNFTCIIFAVRVAAFFAALLLKALAVVLQAVAH